MKNILVIKSSPRGSDSFSAKAADSVLKKLTARHPEAKIVTRDLAKNSPPHVGLDFVNARNAQPGQSNEKIAESLALSNLLVDELLAADVVIVAIAMHNFSLPSPLKAWIDHIVRAGRTFTYSSAGVEGLAKGKQLIAVLASGGVYSSGPRKAYDFVEPYLRTICGFIGIKNFDIVRVEGIAVGEIGPEKALAAAAEQADNILAHIA
jgi:FMN-dependent NADH-azoreductase